MRWTSTCWCCVVALLFQVVWADAPEKKNKLVKGYNERPEEWPRIFAQQKLASVIVETSSTVYHPKITAAPILKRKLGSNKWDLIHEGIQGQKRDATSCPADYQLCPQSMNGGCCPSDRVCGTSSCFASTAAPASACGMTGYIACGINDGGGCCPSDYVCGNNGCTPSVGVSFTETCGLSSYLCPASLGYGCCKNGMGCGISNCYSTEIVTLTLTETTTTTDAGVAQTLVNTLTTAITPQSPTGIATTGVSGVVPKITSPPEAAIAKTKASKTSSGGGLTTPQLGGIIGGAVLILIVLLVATFFIIRRLNNVKVIVEASRSSSSGPYSRHSRPKPAAATPDIDAMSIDPLMMAPSSHTSRSMRQITRGPAQPPSIHSSHHEVEASSPPFFRSPWSPRSPPYNNYNYNYPSGYAPVATSDSTPSSAGYRNPSLESTLGLHQSPASYFDIPPRPDLRDQNLRFGHTGRRPSKHERQWSESSDQSQFSQVSQTSSALAELDAYPDGDRRTSFQKALQGMGMGRLLSRRKSSTPTIESRRKSSDPILTGGPMGRPEYAMSPVGMMGLGHIPEAGESVLEISEIRGDGGGGLTNAGLRELSLAERRAYERKEEQERQYAMAHDLVPNHGAELLRDVDIHN